MTDAHHKVWAHKESQTLAWAPKLESSPPTDEAFRENVARAHLQVAIWRHAIDPNPPPLDRYRHGWMKDTASSSLVPITVPVSTPLAPDEILKLIRCSCESTEPCKSRRCSCSAANIACTTFLPAKVIRTAATRRPRNFLSKRMMNNVSAIIWYF